MQASSFSDFPSHGKIRYNMTNDYLFRLILQQNENVLRGLLCSLLHLSPADISELLILNPIRLGDAVTDKEFRMDVRLLLNSSQTLNLEMQVENLGNWVPRSLSYLCREYDSLDHGQDYTAATSVHQIAFLDYTLFKKHPEFYATYRMRNVRDGYTYSSQFTLSVVELNHSSLATKEDCRYGIDLWARLFKAATWEELRMLITDQNAALSDAAKAILQSNEEYNVRKVLRERHA